MKDQYVVLTGAKNNSGDFLIKERVVNLLKNERPDRELVLLNAWEPLNEDHLSVINSSKLLILAGGPSLRTNIYPDIYPLVENLDDIKVPIVLLGVGWKGNSSHANDLSKITFTEKSQKLLSKISLNGLKNSVRDYSTLVLLNKNNVKNVLMTGCPALIQNDVNIEENSNKIDKITFSLGVSFKDNDLIFQEMKREILYFKNYFKNKEFMVAFHHSLESNKYIPNKHLKKHLLVKEFLLENDIKFIDISKGVDLMLSLYKKTDLHIGYRVHAHILMTSFGKPSILLSEDGRGAALKDVLGGMIFSSFKQNHIELLPNNTYHRKFINKIINKVYKESKKVHGSMLPIKNNYEFITYILEEEVESNFYKTKQAINNSKHHKKTMLQFLNQLP